MQKGLTLYDVSYIIANLTGDNIAPHHRAQNRKDGIKNMIIGGLWCLGGIAVTAITYTATSGGGAYIVMYGAVGYGAIQFLKGLKQLLY